MSFRDSETCEYTSLLLRDKVNERATRQVAIRATSDPITEELPISHCNIITIIHNDDNSYYFQYYLAERGRTDSYNTSIFFFCEMLKIEVK